MTAILAEGISKRFRLSQTRGSIKDRLAGRGRGSHQEFWALREIDVRVEQGETVGILGHNGSGKSTLLKCIAGILKPTTGTVQVRGRVASLLELGAGFHPDLTGRENVFINASFLGISRKEIERRFDDIVVGSAASPSAPRRHGRTRRVTRTRLPLQAHASKRYAARRACGPWPMPRARERFEPRATRLRGHRARGSRA